jgi:hypothetical protein
MTPTFFAPVKRADDETAIVKTFKPRIFAIGRFAPLRLTVVFRQQGNPLGGCIAAFG